jgi:hypothetical protein
MPSRLHVSRLELGHARVVVFAFCSSVDARDNWTRLEPPSPNRCDFSQESYFECVFRQWTTIRRDTNEILSRRHPIYEAYAISGPNLPAARNHDSREMHSQATLEIIQTS